MNIIENFSDNKTTFDRINFVFVIFEKFVTIGFAVFVDLETIIFETEDILKDVNRNRKKKKILFRFNFFFEISFPVVYRPKKNNDKIENNIFKKNNYISFFLRSLADFFF